MEKENKGSKKKVIIAIAVILLLAVIGVMGAVIYKLMNKKEAPRESGFRLAAGFLIMPLLAIRTVTNMNAILRCI